MCCVVHNWYIKGWKNHSRSAAFCFNATFIYVYNVLYFLIYLYILLYTFTTLIASPFQEGYFVSSMCGL